MKNRIWVGKNEHGKSYTHTRKMHIADGMLVDNDGELSISSDKGFNYYPLDIYNLNLKPLEIVEITIDTETQKYEVKRLREIGWYLTRMADDLITTVRFWNGDVWCACPKKEGWIKHQDDTIIVESEKLPYNEYLKSLE